MRIGALLLLVVVAIGGRLGFRRIPSAKLSHLYFEEVEVLTNDQGWAARARAGAR